MEQIIKVVLLGILGILEIMLYFALVGTAAPKILRNHSAIRKPQDRGLKKYVYPTGRAVAYEPHPSVRKYIPHYLLFTEDGCKYVRCQIDEGVKQMSYSVVMFDNRNRVIDVIGVSEDFLSGRESRPVMLHADTSYIALVLDTVNDTVIKHGRLMQCHTWQLGAYGAIMAVLSFWQTVVFVEGIRYVDSRWIHQGLVDNVTRADCLLPALVIGLLAAFLAFLHYYRKGVRWSK